MGYKPVEREEDRGRREKRAATARPERIWDYAVIPYEIDSNFSGVHKVSKFPNFQILNFQIHKVSPFYFKLMFRHCSSKQ